MNIPAVDQRDHGKDFCLASCYLAIIQSFGYDVSMQDLIDEGAVKSNGYVNNTGGYFTRSGSKTYNATNVKKEIDKDNPVIVYGNGHYVVAYDYSGSTIYVMDPYGGVFGTLGNTTLKTPSSYYVCTE